jgi:hypothetical protein
MIGINSGQQSPQEQAGLQGGAHRSTPGVVNPLNPFYGHGIVPASTNPRNPYGIAVGPYRQLPAGPPTGFSQMFPGNLMAVLSQFVNVTRSPVLAQRIAYSLNIHAPRLLQRVPANDIPDGTIGPNLLPKKIPGPRISSTVPIITPVYDYGAQPLG